MAAMPRQSSPGVNEHEPTEAVLEGLAMAGLVAILRNLGDLAELAAEVLDGLQDQAVAVSARARRLTARAKQLQGPNGHRHLICQALTTRTRTQRQQQQQCLVSVAGGEARPRSIVNHIMRCRGPPRLSALDRFDAHGDGACLKRYTSPSFFRENAYSAKHLHQADSDHTRSQTDDSENKSLGLLSMLRRQLKHRHTAKKKASAEHGDHSGGTDVSLTASSPGFNDMETDKANANHPSTTGQSPDAAASDYVGSCSDLQRTSSFEAWLSPVSAHVVEAKQDSAAAETVSSLPRKLCLKQQHAGGLRISNGVTEDFLHALLTDPVFSIQDYVPEKQHGPSFSNQCSNSISLENSGEPTYKSDDAKHVLLPRMQRTGCETDQSLHTTSVLPENTNSSQVDTPPLPPMQWLSVKPLVPTTYRKPFRKDRAGGKILKNTELSGLAIHSYEGRSEHTDRDMQSADRPTETHQVDVQSSATGQGDENVFFSALEQLARASPPWAKPKRPLPEVASCDRITLRNGPSPLHASRSILDCRMTTLPEQIKDESFSPKPDSGTSSPVASGTNIVQRADDMRQVASPS
ncbi:unnamed protein product [Urochloa humidicola]